MKVPVLYLAFSNNTLVGCWGPWLQLHRGGSIHSPLSRCLADGDWSWGPLFCFISLFWCLAATEQLLSKTLLGLPLIWCFGWEKVGLFCFCFCFSVFFFFLKFYLLVFLRCQLLQPEIFEEKKEKSGELTTMFFYSVLLTLISLSSLHLSESCDCCTCNAHDF